MYFYTCENAQVLCYLLKHLLPTKVATIKQNRENIGKSVSLILFKFKDDSKFTLNMQTH